MDCICCRLLTKFNHILIDYHKAEINFIVRTARGQLIALLDAHPASRQPRLRQIIPCLAAA